MRDAEDKPKASFSEKNKRFFERFEEVWWPSTSTLEEAKKAAKQGYQAAIFVAIVTALMVALSKSGFSDIHFDLLSLIDAACFSVIAWGVYKLSRIAALAGLGLYIIERLFALQASGSIGSGIISILFTLMFINSVRGTFAYHKILEQQHADQIKELAGSVDAVIPETTPTTPRVRKSLLNIIFPVLLFGTTGILIIYIVISDKPFSFFSDNRLIDQNLIAISVVNVLCSSIIDSSITTGSGTVMNQKGLILTNAHVIPHNKEGLLTGEKGCLIVLPDNQTGQPKEIYWGRPVIDPDLGDQYDMAFFNIYDVYTDDKGQTFGTFPKTFQSLFSETKDYDALCQSSRKVKLGDAVRIFGYPATSGGYNLTVTEGIVSSLMEGGLILTSAKVDSGNSGGLAVNRKGCMIGIPSAILQGNYQNLGVIISLDRFFEYGEKYK